MTREEELKHNLNVASKIGMEAKSLENWMRRLHFNKSEAAEALGISRSALNAYLAGKYPIPKPVALACAAIAYGLPEP